MHRQVFARRPHGTLELDLCFECHCMWLDQYEASQLTPGAVLQLFRMIHERGTEQARPVAANAKCPVCRGDLLHTHDFQGSNRITYHRCPQWHGRLTTFFQFLREKHFVRNLTPAEIEGLRVTMKQVRCSSCGGAIDIARDAACGYCRAPLAILDADAVERTLRQLSEQERRSQVVDPAAAIDALLAGKRIEQRLARIESGATSPAFDLVHEALHRLMAD